MARMDRWPPTALPVTLLSDVRASVLLLGKLTFWNVWITAHQKKNKKIKKKTNPKNPFLCLGSNSQT